ncbi:alpha/beta fold hydrolase [Sorangium sp. So ce321]|uniref:alpha/beta hydrolase n=1 Tax=Sorangium sp. So ce321 TaxID=3133300 RepID=UPI003F5F5045
MIWLFTGLVAATALVLCWRSLVRRSRFARAPAPRREREEREEGTVETVEFPASDGTRLEGWLFLPRAPRAPLVVMAPGLTGTKDGHLEPFAWRFVRRGMAVLLFDYRCFGGSDGEPRHWADPARHREDYESALRFARGPLASHGRVDAGRIALWGSSFSGGTALVTAARDAGIRAVVAQAPFLETPPSQEPSGLSLLRYMLWTTLDLSRLLPPIYVPVFGRPGEWAFATSVESPRRGDPQDPAAPLFWRTLPRPPRGGWENRMLARMLATFDAFRPMDAAAEVRCPVLLVAADRDDLVPRAFVERAHRAIRSADKRLDVLPCGHFDLYVGPFFARNAASQADFLARQLGVGP